MKHAQNAGTTKLTSGWFRPAQVMSLLQNSPNA